MKTLLLVTAMMIGCNSFAQPASSDNHKFSFSPIDVTNKIKVAYEIKLGEKLFGGMYFTHQYKSEFDFLHATQSYEFSPYLRLYFQPDSKGSSFLQFKATGGKYSSDMTYEHRYLVYLDNGKTGFDYKYKSTHQSFQAYSAGMDIGYRYRILKNVSVEAFVGFKHAPFSKYVPTTLNDDGNLYQLRRHFGGREWGNFKSPGSFLDRNLAININF